MTDDLPGTRTDPWAASGGDDPTTFHDTTREGAIAEWFEYQVEQLSEWSSPDETSFEYEVVVYERPVWCTGEDTGIEDCACGGPHDEYPELMIGWGASSRELWRLTVVRGVDGDIEDYSAERLPDSVVEGLR